jgi:hypothetical protein
VNWHNSAIRVGGCEEDMSTQLGVSSINCLFYRDYNITVTSVYCIKTTTVLYCIFYLDYNSTVSTVCLFHQD